ncbi:hypothetical protein Aperf_G00000050752 [Anoplocephala perfoliata]
MLPTSSQYVYTSSDSSNPQVSLQRSDQQSIQLVTHVPVAVMNDKFANLVSRVVPTDSSAPLFSNKNPLRLVADNGQYIPAEADGDPNIDRVVKILTDKNLIRSDGIVSFNYDNKNILCRIVHAPKRHTQSLPLTLPSQAIQPAPKRRGRRPGQKNKKPEDDDPDYVPDLPEELVLPFPIHRSSISSLASSPSIQDRKYDPEYDIASEYDTESTGSLTPPEFTCELCSRAFHNKAGLSRHKMLKHSGKPIAVGPKVDPIRRAQLRREKLKSALEKASPEDIVELAAPVVAQHVPLWDYLFLRSECANKPSNGGDLSVNLPVPPPEMPLLVAEYLGFVKRFRESFPRLSERIKSPAMKRPDDQDVDEECLSSFGPGPSSAKRKRYLHWKKKMDAELDGSDADQESAHPMPSVAHDSLCDLRDEKDDGVIEVKDYLQSLVLGVVIGRYKSRQPSVPGILPSRYVIEPPLNPEKVEQSPKEQSESLTSTSAKTDDKTKAGPKRAVVITGEQASPAQTIEESNFRIVDIDGDSAPASGTEPSQDNQPSEGAVVIDGNQIEGYGGPIPDELIANGTFLPLAETTGELSDYVYQATTGYVYHRSSGRLATSDEVSFGNPAEESSIIVLSEGQPSLQGQNIYVHKISDTMSSLVLPNGLEVRVEHGPEGVTPELCNYVLQQLNVTN